MAQLKTRPTRQSVVAFLRRIRDPEQRSDAKQVARLMRAVTHSTPSLWGSSIVGYGRYQYPGRGGETREWFLTGFAPRSGTLVVYIMSGFKKHRALLRALGPHRTGVGCLYIRRLSDIDLAVLKRLVVASVREVKRRER